MQISTRSQAARAEFKMGQQFGRSANAYDFCAFIAPRPVPIRWRKVFVASYERTASRR